MKAEIVSTYPLTDSEIKEICSRFKQLKGYSISNTVDKNIKAGFIIKYDGKIIDLSLLTRLNNLKNMMYETD